MTTLKFVHFKHGTNSSFEYLLVIECLFNAMVFAVSYLQQRNYSKIAICNISYVLALIVGFIMVNKKNGNRHKSGFFLYSVAQVETVYSDKTEEYNYNEPCKIDI
ncbi:hypothetical protein BDA99DRAFT_542522 [Phascolomyces articulosus]|uniref:Uncharacterized protein n=1 Tax=Phascolomyces articulosus TaxID=60185 RepID=A0AAD5JPK0_9FUNG|nr:hypothetical protein BDA99DRAFT_542522 [Phascolomyces articulosus]